MATPGEAVISNPDNHRRSLSPAKVVFTLLILAVLGLAANWYVRNRAEFRKTFAARVNFEPAPDTVHAGVPARFILHVRSKNGTPMPDRSVAFSVVPQASAQIIALSGPDHTRIPNTSASAQGGRTDSTGNAEVWINAAVPGHYKVVGTDSASVRSAVLQFDAH